jgi:isopentenyl diphosphate isomerase/L-lactate dehydrogenase-like FMN-dependent dehydrogenase
VGQLVSMPLLTAPCALNALAHPDGELAGFYAQRTLLKKRVTPEAVTEVLLR